MTKRTFDAYSYQILETKQRFISQINNGDCNLRVAEDIDEATMTFAEIKAITSDNPKIKRKMEIQIRLGQLGDLESEYRSNRYYLQEKILHAPQQRKRYSQKIAALKSDIALRSAHDADLVQIGKPKFEERKKAGELLIKVVESNKYVGQVVGYIKGFKIVPQMTSEFGNFVHLIGAGEYSVQISDSDVGTMSRLENALADFESNLKSTVQDEEQYEKDISTAQEQVDSPFEHAEEMGNLQDELAQIDAELDLNKDEAPIVMDEETNNNVDIALPEDEDEEDEDAEAV